MRNGFTLVELLVVIFLVGILASTMMLSIVSTSDSAKASVIVSNLRNAKAAGSMWFSDRIDSSDAEFAAEWTNANMPTNLEKYVDNIMVFHYDYIHISGVGYLIGEPNVPSAIVNKALKQSPGFAILDSNGSVLVHPFTGSSATICVKIK